MFDTLLQLPLFQGISTENLTLILEKTRLHFVKKAAGEVIAKSGHPCDTLIYILRGQVEKTTRGQAHTSYRVSEILNAPYLVEPASLYGKSTHFRSTYTASSDVDIMSISKQALNEVLLKNDIIVFNYLNLLCRRVQNAENKLWQTPATSPSSIVCEAILMHFENTSGRKLLSISQKKLSAITHLPYGRVKQILKDLEQQQLIQIEGHCIHIPEAERLTEI